MDIQHKNESIKLKEQTGEWYVETDAYRYGNTDLNKVREYIDAQLKKGFERYDAFLLKHGGLKRITITSVAENGDIWYTHNGDRSKLNRFDATHVYAITPQSESIFNEFTTKMVEVQRASDERDRLNKEAQAIAGKLTEVTQNV